MEKEQIYTIPQSLQERKGLRSRIESFVSCQPFAPPLSIDDLNSLSEQFIGDNELDPAIKGWLMVEINNAIWRDTVASIPYDKRILLLPKCLNNSVHCKADMDELGLLCYRCNNCSIPNLQDKAEELGMMSMVAEGFTSVVGLVENRIVDTVIGVSCLDSLEKAFPLLINHAVPGLAIPLNKNGCKDTTVDYDYVIEMIQMYSGKEANLLDYDYLKESIQRLFSTEKLDEVLSSANDPTSQAAREWLRGDGKRWRPYLLAATYMTLSGSRDLPQEVQLAAIAVECFHKASLVHDDIQDNDTLRYGKQTVNAIHGVPIAINVGDILLGEGYRLLTSCGNMELLKASAEAHIALCKGQGMELAWSRDPQPLTLEFVLDIFRNKTVPAFDVSLIMGVICAENNKPLQETLHHYSEAMGIAYQLLDDIEDFETEEPVALRPSAVLATLCEQVTDQAFISRLLQTTELKVFLNLPENKLYLDNALQQVKQMAKQYHQNALNALHNLTNIELKRLLFRVTKRILK